MSLLSRFGYKAKNENDPYWEFDKTIHFRPQLNKGEFFKLSGYDFGWFILEPISKFIKDREFEIERGKSLSFGQKALYYWWYLDAQVTNGGFVQFYYNGYGPYVSSIIKGLEHIGDFEMAKLIKKADKIYQKNKHLMDKAQESDLFGSDLYDRLDKMSVLDDNYYELNEKTMSLIEIYIREHPNEICLDENGKDFDMTFTGLCKTFYNDKTVKEEFQLEQGTINGEFKSFHENGNLKEKIEYIQGVPTGEQKKFYESGRLKSKITKDNKESIFIHEWFYENGNSKKLESKLLENNERIGVYKEWYENGQLSKNGTYKSAYEREGDWFEFYQNGNKKVEAEFVNGEFKLKNHWNENGEQTLTNGTGIYVYEYSMFESETKRNEQEYKNYKRHGKQSTFNNGILSLYQEMKEGKEHGITRNYYENGNIKEETIYENGVSISKKEFPLFENPIVVTSIICKMEDEWLVNRELEIADSYPVLTNKSTLEDEFNADISLFDGYPQDYEISYSYFVEIDKNGLPTKLDFLSASNLLLANEVEKNIKKMKFKPALKNDLNTNSFLVIEHKFKLGNNH